ncbi:MAG: hypothetical protein GY696_26490 [Gammaproteobacteria bacterium]|nr:hypothetical protein [Gammaproteobacteria bacterium]
MTRQQQRGYQGDDELASGPRFQPTQEDSACQQSNGGGAPFTAIHTEAHSELGPVFQTLDFDLQSGARPVPDKILQHDRSTSPSHCPCGTDATFQTRIPGRAGKEQTREQGGVAREAAAR